MTTRYKILFSVDILNEYYDALKCKDFTIMPSAETATLLRDGHMLYRVVDNRIIILVKVFESGENIDKPFVTLGSNRKFVFYLQLSQWQFINITNIDFDAFANKRFYFTNAHRNKSGDALYLSLPATQYREKDESMNAITYLPGVFVADASGDLYECIRKTPDNASVSRDTTDNNYWKLRGAFQYPSSPDMIPFVNSITSFNVSSTSTEFIVKAYTLNIANNKTYDTEIPLRKNKAISYQDTNDAQIKNVQVDLTGLLPGRYKIKINDSEFNVYVDAAATYTNCFGVIEILNHLPGGNEFALTDATGKVKERQVAGAPVWLNFSIRFANRLAYLMYVSTGRGVNSITYSGSMYSFAVAPFPPPPLPSRPSDVFISNKPVPLKDKPDIFNILLDSTTTTDIILAPNPNPLANGALTRFDNDFYYTVYLNY